jgi:hypothetical protein
MEAVTAVIGIWLIVMLYVVCIGPILRLLWKAVEELAESPEAPQVFGGAAIGSLLAVLGALLLTRGVGVQGGVLVWLAFVVACGLSMWLPTPLRTSHLFIASALPSLVLLGTALAIYILPHFLNEVACGIVSASPSAIGSCSAPWEGVLGLTLFVALVSIPGIVASLYARTRLIAFFKAASGIDPNKVGRLEKLINAALRIGAALGGAFVVFH